MYVANTNRYDSHKYITAAVGSGLCFAPYMARNVAEFRQKRRYLSTMKDIILTAFDHGITYFDLANNYGPDPGQADNQFRQNF